MNSFHRFPHRLLAILLVSLGAGVVQAGLNDTGEDKCYDGTNTEATCTDTNTGDAAPWPRQDARFGRDAAAAQGVLPKTGGGAAGFDFTKVCMSGELAGQGNCPADPPVGTGLNEWACTKDNHTNLTWSLDSPTHNWTYATTTYPDDMNTTNRCGYSTGWRAPTRRELLSIVHNGKNSSPVIDTGYFPNTVSSDYWSADPYVDLVVPHNQGAWYVAFGGGGGLSLPESKVIGLPVRLVHGGLSFQSFIDNGDGTVTDNETGLMWDKCSWGQTGPDCSGGSASQHPWETANPNGALKVAVDANTTNYKGYNDWRLPSKNELESLVDITKGTSPTIDTTAFPNAAGAGYWTSTQMYAANIRCVRFDYGGVVVGCSPSPVRLVRSGQSFDDFDLLSEPVNRHGNLTYVLSGQTYTPGVVPEGPAGSFRFTARFCNKPTSTDTLLGLFSRTAALTNGNSLINRTRNGPPNSPGGVGSELDFPNTGPYSDGLLAPGECVDVFYEVGLQQRSRFSFYVDVLGWQD